MSWKQRLLVLGAVRDGHDSLWSMCMTRLGFVFCGCIEVVSGIGLRWCFLEGGGVSIASTCPLMHAGYLYFKDRLDLLLVCCCTRWSLPFFSMNVHNELHFSNDHLSLLLF